jgi:hypothetical protein
MMCAGWNAEEKRSCPALRRRGTGTALRRRRSSVALPASCCLTEEGANLSKLVVPTVLKGTYLLQLAISLLLLKIRVI